MSSTTSTRDGLIRLLLAKCQQVVACAPARVQGLGVQQRTELVQRIGNVVVVAAVHCHAARRRRIEAEDEAHRCRLARAVRSEESGDDTWHDLEVEAVDSGGQPVSLGQPLAVAEAVLLGDQIAGRRTEGEREHDRAPENASRLAVWMEWMERVLSLACQMPNVASINAANTILLVVRNLEVLDHVVRDEHADEAEQYHSHPSTRRERMPASGIGR
jgi:hypothetical protein